MPKINTATLNYVALKRMQVGDEVRMPGDLVPEAGTWKNLHNYLSAGYVAVIGGPTTHPGVRNSKSHIGKAEGNAEYTRYRPVDHQGTPAVVPVDVT